MAGKTPKYSLIRGQEAMLSKTITHAFSDKTICVFEDASGKSLYVSEEEWRKGAVQFSTYASEQRLVTSESSNRDKIALFKSLFKGREDVYAHGFAKKQGGIGYSPACANEKTRSCPRWTRSNPGIKCADCVTRRFIPVNDQAIIEHFQGKRNDLRDVMGVYTLTPDCKTWILVADFDKDGWQREAALYRDTCRKLGLSPAVERSRSGNGAHVWLFFDEPIDAETARNLGSVVITHAMSNAAGIGFDSYDRLFPAQSTIPEGGFGNLIALPFQGQAQRQSNSVFVNDVFEPYPDQWRYLSSVSKVSVQQVREIIDSAAFGPLGQLAFSSKRIRKTGIPTNLLSANPQTKAPMPALAEHRRTVNVIKANMLFVSKDALSSDTQNRIKRLAAFGNPEFYRAQAMHQSVFGKPRIVWCGEENERFIMLPRGCEEKLIDLAKEQGFTCSFSDKRNDAAPITVRFSGALRNSQQIAADALLHYENGILMAPTGFGKTVIGAYLISRLKMRTLIIVPKTNLIDQWKERLEQFLEIEDDRPPLLTKSGKPSRRKRPTIGQIGGGKYAPSNIVDIATFQSLSAKDDLGIAHAKPIIEGYELVICDECHYSAAPNLELVMKSVNARRVYGLSATPKRSDGLERIIYMHCGPIRYKVNPKEQAVEQGFKRILQPRFTRVRLASLEPGSSFNQVVELLCTHNARNAMIVEDATHAVKSGRTPLVITNRKEHATTLCGLLEAANIESHVLTGEGTTREKREKIERVRNASSSHFAIVATGSYIGEGFDLPQLDTLLLASPYSFESVITQYSGRLHREHEGKDDVIVYDYVDTSVPMLERMYKKRLKTYAKLGYEIADAPDAQGPGARIITATTWQTEFITDLMHATKRIVISAPYANPKLVESLMPTLVNAIVRGIEVEVILRKPKSEKSLALQLEIMTAFTGIGCKAAVYDAPLTGISVFDGEKAWYGTLPLLAAPKPDDCCLRVDSAEVADDLENALRVSL